MAVKAAYSAHINGGGERMPLKVYRERFIGDNSATTRALWAKMRQLEI